VQEAIRLFKVSTLHAASTGSAIDDAGGMAFNTSPEEMREVQQVEDQLKRRIAIDHRVSVKKLVDNFSKQFGFAEATVMRAIGILIARGDFEHSQQRKLVKRRR
jgi:DNA replication licensing factor MCM5